jgi:hypothetical protein
MKMDYESVVEEMSDKQAGMLIKAIYKYVATGDAQAWLSDVEVKMAFRFIQKDLDAFSQKYEETCARNAENAKKGGAPKGSRNNPNGRRGKNKPELTGTNPVDIDHDVDVDNENDSSPPTPPKGESVRDFIFPFSEDSSTMRRVRAVIPDPDVGNAIRDWIREMYDLGKLTLTEISVESHLRDLLALAPETAMQLSVVNASIKNQWKGFYEPLKPKNKTKPDKSKIIQPGDKVLGWSFHNQEGNKE